MFESAAVGVASKVEAGEKSQDTARCSLITCFLNSESSYAKVRKLAGLGAPLREGFVNTGWRDMEGMSYLADRPPSLPKAFDLSMIYP